MIKPHAASVSTSYLIGYNSFSAVDSTSGAIYCGECDDAIYPETFETLYRATKTKIEESNDSSKEVSIIGKGRARGPYTAWSPQAVNGDHVKATSCRGEHIVNGSLVSTNARTSPTAQSLTDLFPLRYLASPRSQSSFESVLSVRQTQ